MYCKYQIICHKDRCQKILTLVQLLLPRYPAYNGFIRYLTVKGPSLSVIGQIHITKTIVVIVSSSHSRNTLVSTELDAFPLPTNFMRSQHTSYGLLQKIFRSLSIAAVLVTRAAAQHYTFFFKPFNLIY